MASLDVCVVSYQTPNHLDGFIDSYMDVMNRDTNLFLRVNDPSSEDLRVLGRDRPGLRFTRTIGDNIGYAKSVNYLVSQGVGDYIGIFNADARLSPDVWDCVEYLVSNPNVGVLGPRQTDGKGRLTCGGGVIGSQKNPRFRGWYSRDLPEYHEVRDVIGVMGAIYFMPRSVWDELSNCPEYVTFLRSLGQEPLGAFLPTEHFYEETLCTYHAREHGYRVVYYGPAKMYHQWQGSGKPSVGVAQRSKSLFIRACEEVHNMEHEL